MPAIDKQAHLGDTTDFPAKSLREVYPDDELELDFISKALYVGTGGDLLILAQEDATPVFFQNVPSGAIIPVRAKKVMLGTSAENIVALI